MTWEEFVNQAEKAGVTPETEIGEIVVPRKDAGFLGMGASDPEVKDIAFVLVESESENRKRVQIVPRKALLSKDPDELKGLIDGSELTPETQARILELSESLSVLHFKAEPDEEEEPEPATEPETLEA